MKDKLEITWFQYQKKPFQYIAFFEMYKYSWCHESSLLSFWNNQHRTGINILFFSFEWIKKPKVFQFMFIDDTVYHIKQFFRRNRYKIIYEHIKREMITEGLWHSDCMTFEEWYKTKKYKS
jgi:hypothetical protein